jgi:RNA polymerase subunit RPABC4/transcription elongation factor Spt4
MPTFKHPCPYCGKFIDKAVAACPFCGQSDPFAPRRCSNCRKIIEDADWITCPSCGNSLIAPPPGAAATPGTTPASPAGTGTATGAMPGASQPKSAAPALPVQAPPPPRPPLYQDPDVPAQPQIAAGKCSGCGAPMAAGARFCTVCGTMAG